MTLIEKNVLIEDRALLLLTISPAVMSDICVFKPPLEDSIVTDLFWMSILWTVCPILNWKDGGDRGKLCFLPLPASQLVQCCGLKPNTPAAPRRVVHSTHLVTWQTGTVKRVVRLEKKKNQTFIRPDLQVGGKVYT